MNNNCGNPAAPKRVEESNSVSWNAKVSHFRLSPLLFRVLQFVTFAHALWRRNCRCRIYFLLSQKWPKCKTNRNWLNDRTPSHRRQLAKRLFQMSIEIESKNKSEKNSSTNIVEREIFSLGKVWRKHNKGFLKVNGELRSLQYVKWPWKCF